MLMGASLAKVYSDSRSTVIISMLFAFFLPTVSSLTYVVHTDNSRLCLLFFWGAVLAFQRWIRRGQSWAGLVFPILLYYLSSITYEAAALLIFVVPLFVWPVRDREKSSVSDANLLFRLLVGNLIGIGLFVFTRTFLFGGGAVGLRYLFPPIRLMWSYISTIWLYIFSPFAFVSMEKWTVFVSVLVMLFSVLATGQFEG